MNSADRRVLAERLHKFGSVILNDKKFLRFAVSAESVTAGSSTSHEFTRTRRALFTVENGQSPANRSIIQLTPGVGVSIADRRLEKSIDCLHRFREDRPVSKPFAFSG